MKATQVIELLARQVRKHGDLECYVGVLLCDPSDEHAAIHRFPIMRVAQNNVEDALESNNGPAIEIHIHQNEALRSWD